MSTVYSQSTSGRLGSEPLEEALNPRQFGKFSETILNQLKYYKYNYHEKKNLICLTLTYPAFKIRPGSPTFSTRQLSTMTQFAYTNTDATISDDPIRNA